MASSKLARRTNLVFGGLRIYDLDPQNATLVALLGPDGVDPRTLDPEALPEGFRWLTDEEWEQASSAEGTEVEQEKQDAKRLALFDEAVDLLGRTQPDAIRIYRLKDDIKDFLAKVAKK